MSNTARNDVKQLAANIENLAREFQSKLDSDGDFLTVANEIVRNNLTLVFTLGEYYALHQSGTGKNVRAAKVNGTNKQAVYHNVRDNRGRFISKV
jgi:hypothetical protein